MQALCCRLASLAYFIGIHFVSHPRCTESLVETSTGSISSLWRVCAWCLAMCFRSLLGWTCDLAFLRQRKLVKCDSAGRAGSVARPTHGLRNALWR